MSTKPTVPPMLPRVCFTRAEVETLIAAATVMAKQMEALAAEHDTVERNARESGLNRIADDSQILAERRRNDAEIARSALQKLGGILEGTETAAPEPSRVN